MLFQKLSPQLCLVLVVAFLNAFKYFTLATALSLFATNEYGISDADAGKLYGLWGLLHTVWGFLGSFAIDRYGLRVVAIVATSLGLVSRGLLVFTFQKVWLYVVLCGLGPLAEGVCDPLYSVAIKKLTRRRERAFAFSVQYTMTNLGAALGLFLMDLLRRRDWEVIDGVVWSGLRLTLFCTWISAVMCWMLVCFLLQDPAPVGVQSDVHWSPGLEGNAYHQEPAAGYVALLHPSPSSSPVASPRSSQVESEEHEDSTADLHLSIVEGGAPPHSSEQLQQQTLRPTQQQRQEEEPQQDGTQLAPDGLEARLFHVLQPLKENRLWQEVSIYFGDRAFHNAVLFTAAVMFVSMQWSFMDTLMPKFCERVFSANCPWGSIYSINSWMCVLLPPLVSSLPCGHTDDFQIILPGLWIMALSPLCICASISEIGTAMWVFVLSVGEVLWSPRSQSYIASLAPHGREGAFLALAGFPQFLSQYPVGLISGWLLNSFCPTCLTYKNVNCSRDQQWVADPAFMWLWVAVLSITSPLLVTCMAKYFRRNATLHGYLSADAY